MAKRTRSEPRARVSPVQTMAHITDDFVEDLGIPPLPGKLPDRLAHAIEARVESLLFHLKDARSKQYARPFELRLVRDAHRIVLTAYELGMSESEAWYARFKELAEELGYERTDVGYRKVRD